MTVDDTPTDSTDRLRVPARLKTYVTSRWGAAATPWLAGLATDVEELRAQWSLGCVMVAEDANRSLVASTTWRGEPAWLKVDPDPEWDAAADSLADWSTVGAAPAVLARSDPHRATLIADAGLPVTINLELSAAVGEVLKRVHSRPPSASVMVRHGQGAQGVDVALARFDSLASQPFDRALLQLPLPRARRPAVLRHGDLSSRNVRVSRTGAPMLIDPDPRVGAPEYDTVLWAHRVKAGERWREHLMEVSDGRVDERLAAALICHLSRTYIVYLLAMGRTPAPTHVALAQLERAEF